MFFKKDKNFDEKPEKEIVSQISETEVVSEDDSIDTVERFLSDNPQDTEFPYSFHKPEPYPMDLISVITKMLQKLFPDTRKAYLLEARQNKKKGYLLIVDIEPKFLKILNIYSDGETKKVRGDFPIECILYSKSGTITEGIDPFFVKETAESKANNLASKEFSGEIVFSDMPEFELWKNTDKKDVHSGLEDESVDELSSPDNSEEEKPASDEENSENMKPSDTVANGEESTEENQETIEPDEETANTKLSCSDKKELFSILMEYAEKESDSAFTLASSALNEFVFCIAYSCKNQEFSDEIAQELPIDDSFSFFVLVNPDDETIAVPLFTDETKAQEFAKKNNCSMAYVKIKDFITSSAAEASNFDEIVINPYEESIVFPSAHPFFAE